MTYKTTVTISLTLFIGMFVFLYLFTGVFGDTRLGITLRTNTDLENGLVGHWTFDGSDVDLTAQTAEIIDSSASGNNGNWVVHASTTEPGRVGQAIRFSNTEDRVTLGGSTNLLRNVGAATMAFWVKQDELTTEADAIVFDISVGIDTYSRFQVSVGSSTDPNAMVGARAGDGEGFQTVRTSNNPIVAGEWQHVVGVVDYANDEARIYINGVEQPTTGSVSFTASVTSDTSPNSVVIGADAHPPIISDEVIGSVDDLRLYNRELSDSEIQRLYDLGATARIASTIDTNPNLKNGLLAHWTFDGDVETVFEDVTGNGYDGYASTSISATSSIVIPGKIGQAVVFDGVDDEIRIASTFDPPHQGTVTFWVYQNATGTVRQRIFGGSDVYEVTFSGNTNLLQNDLFAGSPGELEEPVIETKRWYHLALTYDFDGSGASEIYINGELSTSSNGTADTDAGGPLNLMIGFRTNALNDDAHFAGAVDDFRVYNRVLSADEIFRLYGLGATTKIANTLNVNPDVQNGLVGHWNFDGNNVDISSSTAELIDSSSNARNLNWKEHASTTYPGPSGQAIEFDGIDDYSIYDNYGVFPTGNLSFAFWVYPTDLTNRTLTVIRDAGANIEFGVKWASINDMEVRFNNLTPINGLAGTKLNEWQHYVITRSGSSITVYRDGAVVDTGSNSDTLDTGTCVLVIGAATTCADSPSQYFEGALDDVRIYDKALSAEEVLGLYNLGR